MSRFTKTTRVDMALTGLEFEALNAFFARTRTTEFHERTHSKEQGDALLRVYEEMSELTEL